MIYNKKDFRIIQPYDLKELKTILDSKIKSADANPILSYDYLSVFKKQKIDSSDFIPSKVNAKKIIRINFNISRNWILITQLKSKFPKTYFYSVSLQVSTEFGSPNIKELKENLPINHFLKNGNNELKIKTSFRKRFSNAIFISI